MKQIIVVPNIFVKGKNMSEPLDTNSQNYRLGYLHAHHCMKHILMEKAKFLFERQDDQASMFARSCSQEIEKESFNLQREYEALFSKKGNTE